MADRNLSDLSKKKPFTLFLSKEAIRQIREYKELRQRLPVSEILDQALSKFFTNPRMGTAKPSTAVSVAIFANEPTPNRVEIISGVAGDLVKRIVRSREDIYRLTPQQFEDLIIDRLAAMRYHVERVGKTNQPDGGVDIIFQPRPGDGLPFAGAVQVKHHVKPELKSGVEVVHSMAGVLERHQGAFLFGMVVTNTSFTNEAEWFVGPMQLRLRLRDGDDVMRWVEGDFSNPKEWREFPSSIQLTSKLIVDL